MTGWISAAPENSVFSGSPGASGHRRINARIAEEVRQLIRTIIPVAVDHRVDGLGSTRELIEEQLARRVRLGLAPVIQAFDIKLDAVRQLISGFRKDGEPLRVRNDGIIEHPVVEIVLHRKRRCLVGTDREPAGGRSELGGVGRVGKEEQSRLIWSRGYWPSDGSNWIPPIGRRDSVAPVRRRTIWKQRPEKVVCCDQAEIAEGSPYCSRTAPQ